MKYTVKYDCSRKRKEVEAVMSLEEALRFEKLSEMKAAGAEKVREFFEHLNPDECPDMILVYRGRAVTLRMVHPSNDAAVARLLNDAANEEVYEIPADAPVRKRRPKAEIEAERAAKKAKDKASAEDDVEIDVEA